MNKLVNNFKKWLFVEDCIFLLPYLLPIILWRMFLTIVVTTTIIGGIGALIVVLADFLIN